MTSVPLSQFSYMLAGSGAYFYSGHWNWTSYLSSPP